MRGLLHSPAVPPSLSMLECGAQGLLAVALPAPFIPQSATSLDPALQVYLCVNVGPQGLPATPLWGLLAAAWPALFHNPPPCWVHQPPPCCESSPPPLPVPAPPTRLDECFFFNSLLVGLPYSLIFCQFWLFLFLNCCCPSFGCARRHSMSTYTFILARSPFFFFF